MKINTILLLFLILLLIFSFHCVNSSSSLSSSSNYVVIFDASSSGSRVHVYNFDSNLDLLPFGRELEIFVQKKPGLSSYASNVSAAAESLMDLLQIAKDGVPQHLHSSTPVRVGGNCWFEVIIWEYFRRNFGSS
ncbi:hypothetical protein CsatB_027709 [Cannabis sativa]|nr:probable apyrase 2 isoform X2 [Cannabis sativa]